MPIHQSLKDRYIRHGQIDPVWIAGQEENLNINNPTSAGSPSYIAFGDTPSVDAFGRLRVSEPSTLFDSKQILSNLPLFWDDQETSGSGTTSTFQQALAASAMSVSANTAGTRIRQTFRRFNYEPGKSQFILMTYADISTTSGNEKWCSYGDGDNGIALVSRDGVMYIRVRSSTTGTPVDTEVAQANWNKNTLPSFDPTKANIFFIDFEWLGVGRVRTGFVIDGTFVVCHVFNNANNLDEVYMSNPNLPLQYGISNDGTGEADTFYHICSSVISEGGVESTGTTGYTSSGTGVINANVVGTIYAVAGIRLKTTCSCANVFIEKVSVAAATNDIFEWLLIFDPTINSSGTVTWSGLTNYGVEVATFSTANPSVHTITGGTILDGGYVTGFSNVESGVDQALRLGASIAGVVNTLVLAARPSTSNLDIQGGFTFRQLQ